MHSSDDTDDTDDLERFVEAQERDATYRHAVEELRDGRKRTHWMWFVLPQIRGLGESSMARRYGVVSIEEARAYLAHPVLGPRLRECAELLADATSSAEVMLGGVDAVKLRSSMTLFAQAQPGDDVFQRVLDRCFGGSADPVTLQMLSPAPAHPGRTAPSADR